MYIYGGYCSSWHRNMLVFDVNDPIDAANDDDDAIPN